MWPGASPDIGQVKEFMREMVCTQRRAISAVGIGILGMLSFSLGNFCSDSASKEICVSEESLLNNSSLRRFGQCCAIASTDISVILQRCNLMACKFTQICVIAIIQLSILKLLLLGKCAVYISKSSNSGHFVTIVCKSIFGSSLL